MNIQIDTLKDFIYIYLGHPLLEGSLLFQQDLLLPHQLRPLLHYRSVVLDCLRQGLLLALDVSLEKKLKFFNSFSMNTIRIVYTRHNQITTAHCTILIYSI